MRGPRYLDDGCAGRWELSATYKGYWVHAKFDPLEIQCTWLAVGGGSIPRTSR